MSMKGRKIQFSASVPYEIFEMICNEVQRTRRSKAQIVTLALREYYSKIPKKINGEIYVQDFKGYED